MTKGQLKAKLLNSRGVHRRELSDGVMSQKPWENEEPNCAPKVVCELGTYEWATSWEQVQKHVLGWPSKRKLGVIGKSWYTAFGRNGVYEENRTRGPKKKDQRSKKSLVVFMPEGAHCGMKINMKTVRHTTSSKLATVQTFFGLTFKIFINSLLVTKFLEYLT